MMNRKRVFWASTALFSGLLIAGAASAQSSGTVAAESTELGEVVVTGVRGPFSLDGAIVAETVPKSRSTITQEYLTRQQPGQTILQSLNLVPGLNYVNADPYGTSGGNIRLRGFDDRRVSLTFDGLPLNDTGNYAVYTGQLLDSELIERASVNLGTTDVDSPTASATGGTINFTTLRPLAQPGGQLVLSAGDFDFGRVFARVDTGEFGPWGTTAYIAASYQNYSKFKGFGELTRTQFNGKIYQDLGGNGNFFSLAGHYNKNRNAQYNNLINLANFEAGIYPENDLLCIRPTGVNGVVNDENNTSTVIRYDGTTSSATNCSNATSLRINPSDTGNVRAQFSYEVMPGLRFTFDPSYQYTMATGGTTFGLLNERDDRLDQNPANNNAVFTSNTRTAVTGFGAITNAQCATAAFGATGVDLNGDGDTCDNVHTYSASLTNTNRYGLATSLIWDLNDDHRFRIAYTIDYGRHRQTGEGSFLSRDAQPVSPWSSSPRGGVPEAAVLGRDGSLYRFRDRRSIAELNQWAAEYRGRFFDDALTLNLGVRMPEFTRELNQFCYSQNGTSTVRCTTETPLATLPNGNVVFSSQGGVRDLGAAADPRYDFQRTEWIAPYSATIEYDDVLPNAGVNFRVAEGQSIYASYAEGISVPRTDNLYQPVRTASGSLNFATVQPETTKSYDVGYRYRDDRSIASIAVWYTDYQDRIVQSRDNNPTLEDGSPNPFFDISIDRNVGAVKQMGVDAQVGYDFLDNVTAYLAASWNDSELQSDLPLGGTNILPTKGKKLVETPEWTFSTRLDWEVMPDLNIGLQGKWVDDRFTTDINDEVFQDYTVVDMDVRYDLTDRLGIRDAYVQMNVSNLFDEEYLGNISSGNNAFPIPGSGGQRRTGSLGSPRTVVLTVGTSF